MQKSYGQGKQRLGEGGGVALHRGKGQLDISLLKDLISILLAMGDVNELKQDMIRFAFLKAVSMWRKRQASDWKTC